MSDIKSIVESRPFMAGVSGEKTPSLETVNWFLDTPITEEEYQEVLKMWSAEDAILAQKHMEFQRTKEKFGLVEAVRRRIASHKGGRTKQLSQRPRITPEVSDMLDQILEFRELSLGDWLEEMVVADHAKWIGDTSTAS